MDARYWKCRPFQCRYKKANALSIPPGKYGRKAKTQRNRRGPAQAVDHVVQFDDKRGTLPESDILLVSRWKHWLTVKSASRTGAAWLLIDDPFRRKAN